jgi:prolyl-tRNA synthetase
VEKAEVGKIAWPAPADPAAPAHEKVSTPGKRTIQEVCAFLGCPPEQSAKLLVFLADDKPVAVMVRGDHEANEGKVRRAFGATKIEQPDADVVEKVTGAPLGFLGPVGIKIPLAVDQSVAALPSVVVGGNEVDVHLKGVVPGRDFPLDKVLDLRNAQAGDPDPIKGEPMQVDHGIEIGHVFKLGTKYSDSMGATFLDDQGKAHSLIMGCYGIGVNRIVAGAVEAGNDKDGIIWPLALAPYQVIVVPLQVQADGPVMAKALEIAGALEAAGADVLIDDRDQRPGFKFKDADLIGIPLRVVVGDRGLKEGKVEYKWRSGPEAATVAAETAASDLVEILAAATRAEEERCTLRKGERAARSGKAG